MVDILIASRVVSPVSYQADYERVRLDQQGFWRNWHASYNLWLVRYMYVPLGGSRRRAVNAWLVFTFVALWHDLEWRLLGWAWLMSLLFAPELVR
jgi:D-alanyl-lipoteichoic acid acyltransferase DltB (MBOAT superfamily)